MSRRQYPVPVSSPENTPRLSYVSRDQYSGDWNSSLHTHGSAIRFGHGSQSFHTQDGIFQGAVQLAGLGMGDIGVDE